MNAIERMKLSKQLAKEFIAEVDNGQASGTIVLKNVLHKLLRLQQITSGFAMAQDGLLEAPAPVELNAAKEEAIYELMLDMPSSARLVVFVVFKHDIRAEGVSVVRGGQSTGAMEQVRRRVSGPNPGRSGGY